MGNNNPISIFKQDYFLSNCSLLKIKMFSFLNFKILWMVVKKNIMNLN